jgi:hypothetical protein
MSARGTAALGLASFALIVVGGLIEPLWLAPSTSASGHEILDYVARNRDGLLASVFVFGLGMTLFLAFAAALCAWLVEQPGVARAHAAVFGAGSAALTTLVFAGFATMLAFAYRAPALRTPRELYDLCFGLLAVSGFPTALALGAFAAIVFGARPLPAWTGWLAVVGAAAHLLIAASFFFGSGFLSLEGGVIVAIPITLFVWFAGTSGALLRLPAAARSS